MKCLYISYNGMLEPLLQSQCIPYLKGLTKKGIDFTVLSFEKKDGSWGKTLNLCLRLKRDLSKYGIKWHWLAYHKQPTIPATLFDMFCGLILAGWLVIKARIEVVHARATIPAALAFVLRKIFKVRFIFDARGINAEEYVDAGIWPRRSLKYKSFRLMEKKLLQSADSLVVLTKRASRIILRDYAPNQHNPGIQVIPCCVDLSVFNTCARIKEPDKSFTFVYSGSVGSWYLLEEMLDFFIAAKEQIPHAQFLILARSDKDIIEESLSRRKLGNKDYVSVLACAYSDIPGYLNKAAAGIFFIKPTFSKQASSPIKMAEYLASGLPIIVNSGIGDVDEIVRSNNIGVIVEGFNRNCYSDAIRALLGLLKEGPALGQRCREAARDYFSLEKGVELYWQAYQGLGVK